MHYALRALNSAKLTAFLLVVAMNAKWVTKQDLISIVKLVASTCKNLTQLNQEIKQGEHYCLTLGLYINNTPITKQTI
jgi:hypothetical protein